MPASATARTTPTGIKLENGWQTLITLSADPDICLWERSVKPPGMDGGEKIDTSTMFNTDLRTFAPRRLKEYQDTTAKCGYDPNVYSLVKAQLNVKQTITVTFPDGSTFAQYGWISKLEFDDVEEGTFPTVTATFCFSNADPTTAAESAATYTNVSGT